MLTSDLEGIDVTKEVMTTRKNILKRHGVVLGKREEPDAKPGVVMGNYEPMGKRVKMGERFENHEDIFGLDM